MSTKLGTIVKFLSGGKSSASERLSAPEPPDRSFARFRVAALAFHQGGELSPEECGNRKAPLRGEHTGLAKRLLIERERDISGCGH